MKNKTLTAILLVIATIALFGAVYWYFFMRVAPTPDGTLPDSDLPSAFQPLDRPFPSGDGLTDPGTGTSSGTPIVGTSNLPILRLLSSTPVGGYGASSTPATTTIRWVDRGRGNVFETNNHSSIITTLSNTIVPRVYESAWNRNLTAFIGSLYQEGDSDVSAVHASIVRRAIAPAATSSSQSSSSTITPYELRGSSLPEGVVSYAYSPDRSRLFLLIEEGSNGVGYTAASDGSGLTRIFTTPVVQANVSWPSDNVIAVATKGSSAHAGFLYFVDPRTGAWRKILGPIAGLSTSVSRDGRYVIYSSSGNNRITTTAIYTVADGEEQDATIRTIAEKCAWGNTYREMVYCGVPSQPIQGSLPDDWYSGKISSTDRIWQVNATTANTKLVSSLIDQADRTIDVYNISLDPRDNYLLFMNKNDLSLWSLDLVRAD